MRHTAVVQGAMGNKRLMLVENSQDTRYHGGVVCFIFFDNIDGPAEAGEFYEGLTVAQVKYELQDHFGIEPDVWNEIADQLPGCQEDWIAPVRIARDKDGEPMIGQWEQLVDQRWVRIPPDTDK